VVILLGELVVSMVSGLGVKHFEGQYKALGGYAKSEMSATEVV